MIDNTELIVLRKLAEAANPPPELGEVAQPTASSYMSDYVDARMAFARAASPEVLIALLDALEAALEAALP